jgi:hypothetical protein
VGAKGRGLAAPIEELNWEGARPGPSAKRKGSGATGFNGKIGIE